MATYDSIHTGTAVDQAVERTLANKSKGDSSTPIYLDANGEAVAITKSTTPTEDDNKLITSGAMYTELSNKYNKADIATSADLGTSTTLIPSQKAVKSYADKVFSGVQPTVVAGSNIVKNGNELSVNPDGLMNPDEITGKREHYGEYVVGYDSEVLEKVERARHSSFDLSKFTVIGSPTITDDGIASGFGSSNYLQTITLSEFLNKSWEITGEFPQTTASGWRVLLAKDSGYPVEFGLTFSNNSSNLNFYGRFGDSEESDLYTGPRITISTSSYSVGTIIQYKLSFNIATGTYNLAIKSKAENNWTTGTPFIPSTANKQLYEINTAPTTKIQIGASSIYYWNGSIDLKQFSITVDGVEVFSGNKTGIDMIKPDNYITVGSPTITSDYIATGAANSYLSSPDVIDLSSANSWEIKFRSTSGGGETKHVFGISIGDQNGLMIDYGNLYMSSGNGWNLASKNNIIPQDGNMYYVKLGFTGTQYYAENSIDGINYTTVWTNSTTTKTNAKAKLMLLNWVYNIGSRYFNGQLDLKHFSIIVNGAVVYQPMLTIPYTLSKDGKKIVDEYYRANVTSEVEQASFTPYYTLQAKNKGNYIIVGSPTISSDFVASGFSSSNAIKTTLSNWDLSAHTYIIELHLPNVSTTEIYPFEIFGLWTMVTNGKVYMQGWNGSINDFYAYTQNSYQEGDDVKLRIQYKLNDFRIQMSVNNGGYGGYTQGSSNPATTSGTSTNVWIGSNTGTRYYSGSIDLNAFKIYVDGNLTYQAVIPPNYTMATNKPQDIIYTYQNGANKYIQRANLQLEEYGTCTSGTAVTFQKPFRDDNYALTVPYSAKSKTGFTPSQTGDWKAKGFYSL